MSTALKKETSMAQAARLTVDGKELELPVVVGTEGEHAVDISKLRGETGYITLDDGYMNTGSTLSAITFLDGEKGILRYRGYPIEQLGEKCDFIEVAYLLIYGELPRSRSSRSFTASCAGTRCCTRTCGCSTTASRATPIRWRSSARSAGRSRRSIRIRSSSNDPEQVNLSVLRLMAKLPTIAAYAYKKSIGQPFVYPRNDLTYCENFLRMMFAVPTEPFDADPDFVDALNLLLIVHADHEQNCSTSTVRMVGSSDANLFASISAGICALWGPLHGGANEACVAMLQQIAQDGGNVKKYVDMAKDKNSGFRLMGFGHRVYKNFDPRATIIKKACDKLLAKRHIDDPIFEIAQQLEEVALKDEYFIERKLYPNVDFYSGVIYRAIGIPVQMFTVLFAMGRLPGWIAHWLEMRRSPTKKICRPRQIYTGTAEARFCADRESRLSKWPKSWP